MNSKAVGILSRIQKFLRNLLAGDYNFEKKHISKFKNSLKLFREYFPEYKDMRLHGIIGTRVVTPKIKEMAISSGFLLIKKAFDGNAEFVDLPGFEISFY